MARETREQRAARESAERQATRVREFREDLARERAKRTYTARDAFMPDGPPSVLWMLVDAYARHREDVERGLVRLRESLDDALGRMARNEQPNWHSAMVGAAGSDLDMAVARLNMAAEHAARVGAALGWWVPDVQPQRVREKRALRLSLSVEESADGGWVVLSRQATDFWLRRDGQLDADPDRAHLYDTEELAWLAAMALAGERG
jgi:hypothetical protein